jgi:asparagine synthase (glutamine-hydrolysing)
MCGIFGVLGGIEDAPFDRMGRAIFHRGPDSGGLYVDRDRRVGLGVRRLSIIDVEGGQQPIQNEDGTVCIVFNGEVYNYLELRKGLEAKGHRFSTHSDTETIVHLYEEYGPACVHLLRGMFGFALWDVRRRRLMLARDRLGVKPLYYHASAGRLVFASEIKAILEHPAVARSVDRIALATYLALQYVPHPRTMFEGVAKLPPGHLLLADEGDVRIERYWEPVFADTPRPVPDAVAAEACEALLQESVALRLVADVPVGALLSGGVDSSLVVALMARAHRGRVKTFTVGFEEAGGYSELEEARRVANLLGTDHHEEILKPVQVEELLPRLVWHLDEPLADQAAVPTYLICRAAAAHVKVVLTGEGGDEVFGGYPRYAWFRLAQRLRVQAPTLTRLLSLPLAMLPVGTSLSRKSALLLGDMTDGERHCRWIGVFTGSEFDRVRGPALREGSLARPAHDRVARVLERAGSDSIHRLLQLDLDAWFPDNILAKVDKMSMASSLEAREPLLDHRLVEVMGTVPSRLKVRGLRTKVLLKLVAERVLPASVVHRRKHPFRVPVGPWLRGPLVPLARELLDPTLLRRDGYFDPGYVSWMLSAHREGRRDFHRQLWALLCFQLWHAIFVRRTMRVGSG